MSFRSFIVLVAVAILVAMHFTLRPLLDWRAGVDFLVIASLLVAVRARPGGAAVTGFVLGLAMDAMAPVSLGAGALAMTIMAFAASRLKAAFFADDLALNAVFVFIGKALFDVIYVLAEGRLSGLELLWQLMLWTPLAALATSIVGLVALAAVRPTLDQRRHQ